MLGGLLGRWQTGARNQGTTDFPSSVVKAIITPPARLFSGVADICGDFASGLVNARTYAQENRSLKDLARAASLYDERLLTYQKEVDRLRRLIELPPIPGKQRIPASVIQYAPLENRITLNRGKKSGIKPQLPVISGEGLVGVVQTADENTSQVLLISSPQIRLGAMVQRSPAPYGLIRGESANKMILEILDIKSTVEQGDVVVTSGLSETIPGGIPIGLVAQIEADPEFGAVRSQVFPYVQVGDVREVFVLR